MVPPKGVSFRLLVCSIAVADGARVLFNQAGHARSTSETIVFVHRESQFTTSQEQVDRLCTEDVVREACEVLGASADGKDPWATPWQLQEVLASSNKETEALLHQFYGDALEDNKFFGVRSFCEKAVSHIPKILGMAIPDAPWMACVDDGCSDGGIHVSDDALEEDGLHSPPPPRDFEVASTTLDNSTMMVPPTPEEVGRDLLRRTLNVVFGIFPAVDEQDEEMAESDNQAKDEDRTEGKKMKNRKRRTKQRKVEQKSKDHIAEEDVLFTPKTDPHRHSSYRTYVIKAQAWITSAIRRIRSARSIVKKWFILSTESEIDRQIVVARKHLSLMHSLTSRVLIRTGIPEADGGACSYSDNGWSVSGTLAYVMVHRNILRGPSLVDPVGCGEKSDGRYVVNICEFYWRPTFRDATRIGTIVHESSHHFGTDDKGYCDAIDCLALSPQDAQNNADTYTQFVKEVVQNRFLQEDLIESDFVPDPGCNTGCDPSSFHDGTAQWQFTNMLPTKTCGYCERETHIKIKGFTLWGDGCTLAWYRGKLWKRVSVSSGFTSELCCRVHQCTVPTTTTTTLARRGYYPRHPRRPRFW